MDSRRQLSTEALVRRYLWAKRHVIESGYGAEAVWQAERRPLQVTTSVFLREATWVILSAGMSERVVRRRFESIRRVLWDFDVSAVVQDRSVRERALAVFAHERKIDAIMEVAAVANSLGDEGLRRVLTKGAEEFLGRLPYMGPATTRHLAKNLGWPVAKPDRHLVRLAARAGRPDPDTLCGEISVWLGDPVHVVDVVLWRWCVLHERRCRSDGCDGLPHP